MSEDAKWEAKRSFSKSTGRWRRVWWDPKTHAQHFQREARWTWERAYGPIPEGYVIHHVNEDPTDDSLLNLLCLPRWQHREFHAWLRGGFIFVAGAKWPRCCSCREHKSPDEFRKRKGGGRQARCKGCERAYQREYQREYKRDYWAANRDRINARRRDRYAAERAAGRALT